MSKRPAAASFLNTRWSRASIAICATADELATRLRGLRCHVNLIPLNAVRERDLHPPTRADVQNFLRRLEARHISATVRREMGADIEGACGQLRRRVLEDRKER